MAYIGPEPNPGQNREVDDISSGFNGSEVNFTLQVNSQNVSPGSSNAIIVSLGGVVQNPGTDYTVAASTLTFTTAPASGLSFFGLVLGQQIDTEGTADNSITSGMIIDQAVTLAKLPHGTGSNDGKFLRANNGADPTFETVSAGTSLSGSTNNTVTTVTGASAIQGEANLTFDGTDLDVSSGNSSIRITSSSNTPKINFNANNVSDAARITIAESSGSGVFKFQTIATNGGSLEDRANFRTATGAFMINSDGSDRIGEPRLHVTQGGASTNVASLFFNTTHDRDAVIIRHNGCGTQTSTMIKFLNESGNQCGKIASDTTNTVYLTSSDYRLKENEVLISDGITRLKTLKPYRFNFKAIPSKTVDGFFAHEVTAVPEAISGIKDETEDVLYRDDDEIPVGKSIGDVKETVPKYQGIDQSKLVPLLTAALQEAITKIETLETKVAALEAA